MISLTIATALLVFGKINGENWVYALAVVLTGHNAEGVVNAYRGN